MTKQERKNELKEIVKKENELLQSKVEKFIQGLVKATVAVNVYRDRYDERFHLVINLIDDEKQERIFGTEIDVYFERRTSTEYKEGKWIEIEYKDSGLMGINYGSCGTHTQLTNNGGLKQKDILVGKLWENEEQLTKMYNEINWEMMNKLADLQIEIDREQREEQRKEREQKALEKKQQIDAIINDLKEGQVIEYIGTYNRQKNFTIIKITNKCVYTNRYVDEITGTWRERFSKEEMAEFILELKQKEEKQCKE